MITGKLGKIDKIAKDMEYLRGEYQSITLWGSAPDGDVHIEKLMLWLQENEGFVRHLMDISQMIKELEQ